jgi:glycolate oxidase iron-sulfur subunit
MKENLKEHIDEILKSCIHCGMCLPACPTYQVTGNEGYSPRGRIYTIANQDTLINQKQIFDYLDTCLSCSACETVCPSAVQYQNIIDYARYDLKLSRKNKGLWAFVRKYIFANFLTDRSKLTKLKNLLANFDWLSNIAGLVFPKIKLLNKLKPNLKAPYKSIDIGRRFRSTASVNKSKTVALMLGCVMDTFYNQVHHDSIKLLNACGYDVLIPNLDCCGALACHSGEFDLGLKQRQDFVAKAKTLKIPLVVNSAGCGAFLKEQNDIEVLDIIELISDPIYDIWHHLPKQDLQIVYHPACHLNHKQGLSSKYLQLLERFFKVDTSSLNADTCCGSAGIYNILEPDMAFKIGEKKAMELSVFESCIVASANPGCINQLQAHLGSAYEVVHPISLLANLL